ncbi:MAG TPA: transcription-repair coupling factor [Candidatus Paceibacterota bacterium]|nr:transcription-repair coupling factor [Candidatus Paceibacterota bacterium]
MFARITAAPAVRSLARGVENGGLLSCAGVSTAAQPFVPALLRKLFPNRPIVVVADNLKTQESFHQDIQTWLRVAGGSEKDASNEAPLFFPDWEILPHEAKLPHADVISDRLETLIRLTRDAAHPIGYAPIVVTSVVALLQRTFAREALGKATRTLNRGDKLDPLDFIEWLEEQGYEPEAQVTQKGEIALRGGILDLFPLTSPWPVRLEFFGDELESLRFFDPQTQMSREEVVSVTIPPGGELGILKKAEGGNAATIQQQSQPASLLEYLPSDTLFVLCEPEALDERADQYVRQVEKGDPFSASWSELREQMQARGMTQLELHETEVETGAAQESQVPPLPGSLLPPSSGREGEAVLDRRFQSPPSGALELGFSSLDAYRPLAKRPPEPQIADAQRREFFQQLHRWLRQDYSVHVFCNNDGERQRFEEIWRDLAGETAAPKIHLGSMARGFISDESKLVVVTDAEIFGRYKVQRPRRLKSSHALATRSALDIDFTELEEGDLVVHVQHGVGRFLGLKVLPPGAGTKATDKASPASGTECLVLEYAANDPAQPAPKLYVPVTEAHLVSKYVGAGKIRPPLNTLGGTRWNKAKEQAERAVRDVAADLLEIQAARESQVGHSFKPDTPWQREFEGSFIFEETADQLRAINETKSDMERPKPMDRLICGDVGFGKTEVAIRAAFKAVMDGRQVAVLVPTTVLAQQHFNTFRERMADYPIRVELLSRFRTRREQQRVVIDLAAGAVDIVIGTHRLIQSDIVFKDLGLVVIDEEQRFGVLHKEKFKMLRKLVDVLTLSATPIPRTLYLALTGARDMSAIQTPPHDRLPVETVVTQYDERVIRDAIQRELNRGGQVFFLHNRVITIHTMEQKLRALMPQARIVVGHGQMDADDLEEVMTKFVNGEADVLLSTTIIESGLDIPNANTIIIDRADRFGLSELYQLRGRVGRYKHQAYAYLLLPRHAGLLTDVRKRISAIKQYSTLGSGFKIAMRDLEIRGAGNLLGSEQSGHITAVGFDLYCQLLKQSISALKGEKVKPRVEVSVRMDFLDVSAKTEEAGGQESGVRSKAGTPNYATLPHSYVPEPQHRIDIYRKLAQATDKVSQEALVKELRDRFGPIPPPVELLLQIAELKSLAAERGITVVEVKDEKVMLTRRGDFIMVGGKFPRLAKKDPKARLKEIKRLLLAI